MELRPYQQDAIDALYHHLRTRRDNPCLVIPTGGGKTPVISHMCRDIVGWGQRAIIVAHVKELLEQSYKKIKDTDRNLPVGIYSAGLGKRDTCNQIIVAGIQSVYRRACDIGSVQAIIVDEAHMIPPDGDGMYLQFINDMLSINPNVRIVGLTATPYRLSSGMICGPDNVLNHICYEVGIRDLIAQGFLSPLVSRSGGSIDTSGLHVRGGEYVASDIDALMDTEQRVSGAVEQIVRRTVDRRSCLVFCCSVKHAVAVRDKLRSHGMQAECVTGETPDGERADIIEAFKSFRCQYLCNVNVLTTGFDAPGVDCVVLLRPTCSPGLYYQMVGRGFRLAPGKANCLVLDFGSNVERLGPVDRLDIVERKSTSGQCDGDARDNKPRAVECQNPNCQALVDPAYELCPECSTPMPKMKASHAIIPHEVDILSTSQEQVHNVTSVEYRRHTKRDNPEAPPTMRVDYECGNGIVFSEWICIEHHGYAKAKAEKWFKERSGLNFPISVEEAVSMGKYKVLAEPVQIVVAREGKYHRIVRHVFAPCSDIDDHVGEPIGCIIPDEDTPF